MPIYEVVLNGRYFNQATVNRWNYVSGGSPAAVLGSFGLANAMGLAPVGSADFLFGSIKALVSNQAVFTSFSVKNLYDPEDFYSAPFGTTQTGAAVSQAMSPTQAYGFRSNQVSTEIDRGTKRFAGCTEGNVGDGGIVDTPTVTTLMQPIADKMSAVLTYNDEGNIVSYSPAILSRQAYVTPSGKTAYKKWPTEAEQLDHAAIGIVWEPYNSTRTQGSRQYGRGA
jgi:hypothetical protein